MGTGEDVVSGTAVDTTGSAHAPLRVASMASAAPADARSDATAPPAESSSAPLTPLEQPLGAETQPSTPSTASMGGSSASQAGVVVAGAHALSYPRDAVTVSPRHSDDVLPSSPSSSADVSPD